MRQSHLVLSMLALMLLTCPNAVRAQSRGGYTPVVPTGGWNTGPIGGVGGFSGPDTTIPLPPITLGPVDLTGGQNNHLPATSTGSGSPPKSTVETKSDDDHRHRPAPPAHPPQNKASSTSGGSGQGVGGPGVVEPQSESTGWPWWVWVIIVLVVLGALSDRH